MRKEEIPCYKQIFLSLQFFHSYIIILKCVKMLHCDNGLITIARESGINNLNHYLILIYMNCANHHLHDHYLVYSPDIFGFLTHSLIHYFETVPNSKQQQTTTEM